MNEDEADQADVLKAQIHGAMKFSSVVVRADVMERLRKEAALRGLIPGQLLHRILEDWLDRNQGPSA